MNSTTFAWPMVGRAAWLLAGLVAIQFLFMLLPHHQVATRFQLQRKIQHALTSVLIAATYAWFLPRVWMLMGLAITLFAALLAQRFRSTHPEFNTHLIQRFRVLLREHEHVVLPGAFWLLLGFFVVVMSTPKWIAVLCMLYAGLGDPLAGLVSAMQSRVPQRPIKSHASIAAMATVCALLTWPAVSDQSIGIATAWMVVGGLVPAISERMSQKLDDNLVVPIVSAIALSCMQFIFPLTW